MAIGDGVINREMKHTILTAFFINSMERTKGHERIKKTTNFKLCSYFSSSKIDKLFTIKLNTKNLKKLSPGLWMEIILCSW